VKVEFVADPPTSAKLDQASAITIFVHGFRGVDGVVATYFQETTSHLVRDPLYPGKVVVYDWPSTARDFFALSSYERARFAKLLDGVPQGIPEFEANEPIYGYNPHQGPRLVPDYIDYKYFNGYAHRHDQMWYLLEWESLEYQKDQKEARAIGAVQLAWLLVSLREINKNAQINLVAHSMGCYVIQHALTLNPSLASLIHKIVWIAPDVDYGIFDDGAFIKAIAQVASLEVFYSRNDGALKWPSRLQNGGQRLGASGP
jgi:esterase/lipase superfamily enzyme